MLLAILSVKNQKTLKDFYEAMAKQIQDVCWDEWDLIKPNGWRCLEKVLQIKLLTSKEKQMKKREEQEQEAIATMQNKIAGDSVEDSDGGSDEGSDSGFDDSSDDGSSSNNDSDDCSVAASDSNCSISFGPEEDCEPRGELRGIVTTAEVYEK
jgi:hypothetical protein